MTADVNVVIDHSEYTILVVDDVVSNVLLLKVLLTNEKFKVVTANNGKDALVQAAEKQPDLILLDVMMPEMNGFEVSEKLKANPVTQNIPIIFLTALNTTSDIVKGFKVGANDFISKPFNKEELVIRVTHQISLVAAKRIILRQTEELRKTIMGRDKLYSVIAHDLRSHIEYHNTWSLRTRCYGTQYVDTEFASFSDWRRNVSDVEHGQPKYRGCVCFVG